MPIAHSSFLDAQQLIKVGILGAAYRIQALNPVDTMSMRTFCEPLASDFIPTTDIEMAIEHLMSDGLVERVDDIGGLPLRTGGPGEPPALTASGERYVRTQIQKRDSLLRKYLVEGDEWLLDALEDIYGELDSLDPFRYPENLTINLKANDPLRLEAIHRLDELSTLVRRSNAFAAASGQQMREALQRIEDGRTLLAPGKTDMGRIETMFFGALDFIALKFAETPVAEAAQLAWKAIKALLQQFI